MRVVKQGSADDWGQCGGRDKTSRARVPRTVYVPALGLQPPGHLELKSGANHATPEPGIDDDVLINASHPGSTRHLDDNRVPFLDRCYPRESDAASHR